ncbi:MAG: iron-regulated outer membrane protein [Pseudomonadota bacterium]|jgi:PKHD-type hydroxylase
MLLTIPDVLSPEALQTLRAQLAQADWEAGSSTAGLQATQVKHNSQLAETWGGLPALRDTVMQALQSHGVFMSAALPLRLAPPQFNRYAGQANHYGWHADSAVRRTANGHVRADVSATLFLSDPDSYEGGELRIQDTFGTHSVKGAAGSLVLYPSSSIHEVSPVTQGERLACFMFIQSLVRSPEQRRLLFDMDMALLALRQDHGDTAPVVQLTGTYHNLLRQWAET